MFLFFVRHQDDVRRAHMSDQLSDSMVSEAPPILEKGAIISVRIPIGQQIGRAKVKGISYKCRLVGDLRAKALELAGAWRCEVAGDPYPFDGIWHLSAKPLLPEGDSIEESVSETCSDYSDTAKKKSCKKGRRTSRKLVHSRRPGRRR